MSALFDLNDCGDDEPFPPSIYRLRAKVKDADISGNVLHLAKNLRTSHLKLELTVEGGMYHGYRLWHYITLAFDDAVYTDPDDERSKPITPEQADKYRTTVRRGRSQLKQLVDSAYGFGPNDKTGNAKVVRREISEDLTKVDGLVFWAQVEIRKGRNGYGDSNCIGFIIVPGDPEYPQRHGGELALRPGDPDDKPSDLDDEIPY